ncbi:MAG: hypothetical protein HQ572_04690 [Candidatus Omnitrophica bacterium]|nr:hypothetical protein [Candidatus Omnitrophota bacterium]
MESPTEEKKFICTDCFKLKKCKDSAVSWVFFFIALIAVVAIRAVNAVLDINPLLAKIFWYIGVAGFFIFFIYKYRYDSMLQKEVKNVKLVDKLLAKDKLSDHDYEILGTILCKLSSKKDKINYFFIFFFSGLALLLAIYVDFIK